MILSRASYLFLALFLSSCLFFTDGHKQAQETCDKHYTDLAYIGFCQASLTIYAAKESIKQYEALPTPPDNLQSWKNSIVQAELKLARAQAMYSAGDITALVTLDSAIDAVEAWLYAD